MTAPDRITLYLTAQGQLQAQPWGDAKPVEYTRADLATPAAMTTEVRALVEAAQEYISELEWHYGGGETDLGRKYRAALRRIDLSPYQQRE